MSYYIIYSYISFPLAVWGEIDLNKTSTNLTRDEGKLSKQMERKLKVSQITEICFEESDGTETPFNELFEFRTSIGAGGFGFVVAALDKSSGEEVALKLLSKEESSETVVELFK